jgi:hypothetical protein
MAEDREYRCAIRQISECLNQAYIELRKSQSHLEEALSAASKIDSADIDRFSLALRMVESTLDYVVEVLQIYE